jgi:site-specific DNA-methyltransferase (adenine-specific)
MEINKIYEGDCLEVLRNFEDCSIDCCITSPPYWALRDYGMEGQLGLEPDFKEYINKLCNIFNEVKRVLKNEGTLWVNIGDTYYTKSGTGFLEDNLNPKNEDEVSSSTGINKANEIRGLGLLPEKSLCNIPSRFSIEMQDRNWILRNEIIWHKNSVIPSSADDRFTVDFEKLYFFVKQRKYYFEQQLEKYTVPINRWGGEDLIADGSSSWDEGTGQTTYRNRSIRPNPEGRNMRTTWSINPKPTPEAHFATFPQKLVAVPILSGCPEHGIVLDPFIGSGTTAIVARKFNRNYIGIELNPKYIEIANNRLYKELGMFL